VRDLLLPVAISLGALGLVLWLTYEPGSLGAAAASFRPGVFALAVLALCVQVAAGGLRLRHVSHGVLSRAAGIRGQLTWDFMSAVTPSAMGGAPFAGFFMARENRLPYGQVTAVMVFTIVMDQIWFASVIVLMYVSAIWVPVFPTTLGAVGVGTVATYLGGILLWFGFFGYATLVKPELIERAAAVVVRLKWLRRFEPTVRTETARLRDQARALRGQPLGFYLKTAGYTVFYWLGRYTVVLLVALSFTSDLRPVLFLLRTAGLGLAGLIMPTPGGSGGIEALFLLYLAPLLPAGFGGPVLLAWRLLSYHFILVVGSFVAGGAVRSLLRGEGPPERPAEIALLPEPDHA
jgi:uncharacterized protein (TIRG00374 family)